MSPLKRGKSACTDREKKSPNVLLGAKYLGTMQCNVFHELCFKGDDRNSKREREIDSDPATR